MHGNLQPDLPPEFQGEALQARLQNHLIQLVGDRDPYLAAGRHHLAQQYVQSTLAQWGVPEAHEFQVRGRCHTNWILPLPATTEAAKKSPLIVGAHYDTVPGTPGADDNASGVGVLLELARFFAQFPAARPLWLIAFDMEEYGLLGSQAYVEKLKATQQPVHLMLSLEMLGYYDRTPQSQNYPSPLLTRLYPHRGDFIALIGNLSTLFAMRRLSQHLKRAGAPCEWLPVPNRGKAIPATRRSDHAAFWEGGYRALMVTDTAFLRNPHYHQASDRLDTLDLEMMTRVCQGLIQGLQSLT